MRCIRYESLMLRKRHTARTCSRKCDESRRIITKEQSMENLLQKYPGLKIEPAYGEEGYYVAFWMSSDEWKAFKKLGLKKCLAKRFEFIGTTLYADNIPYAKELRFFVKDSEWSGFESSRLFRNLAAYAELLYREKERMRTALHEQECKEETVQMRERWFHPSWFRSLWVRVSKSVHHT